LPQRYTRREVERILGLDVRRLRYWERLRLVAPQARWGERFYSFGDLVALRTIQRITQQKIPARRLRRAVSLVEQQFSGSALPLQELQVLDQGREVLVVPPGANGRPFNPIRQQWVFAFGVPKPAPKLHSMSSKTPEQWFDVALACEARVELLCQAVEGYRHAIELAPEWIEAHINLGVVLYQMGQTDEARAAFQSAVQLDPSNGISRYNLGCVLEEQGNLDAAIEQLVQAARALPAHADIHFNLALAYEKRGQRKSAREHWMLYLRYAPNGPWADQARAHLKQSSERRKPSLPIPFPRKA
jgi:tetratricopeptide (TPR) repeat protein